MQVLKDKHIWMQFNKKLYQNEPLYITSEKYWDGGIQTDSPLTEKAAFYLTAERMSAAVKQIVRMYGGEALIGRSFCEHGEVYAKWSDLKCYELFREISGIIKKNKYYMILLPEDEHIIDLIVESNFRYFSYISLYLPKANFILQPTCHTEVLVYSESKDVIETLKEAVKTHSDTACAISVSQ